MRVLEGEEKERAIKKLEFHKERNQLRRSYGRNSDEVKALEAEYMESMSNTYPKDMLKGNAENILPLDVNSVSKKATSVSESASYEEGAEETIIVKSGSETGGDVAPETETKESLTPVIIGGGGGDSEVGDLLYKGG